MLRYLTAGESHGEALVAILEGMAANLPLSVSDINKELIRRQVGYGRGGRMKIEKDEAEILSGVRLGKTMGSPISLLIKNRDWENWKEVMAIEEGKVEPVTKPRPGHADLAGAIKYNQKDIRNVLERASARETAARVAVGAVCKKFLSEFKLTISSQILHIGGFTSESEWKKAIDKAKAEGDSLGGVFEIRVENVPIGLGSYVQADRRLDGRLAGGLMSIPAIKGVGVGLGFKASSPPGSKVHDEIFFEKGKFVRKTNNAGGLEGGITNGQPIIIKVAMKPISTLKKPLKTVDLATKEACEAHVERADVCALEAAAVVGEGVVAFEIAKAFLEKFGEDSLQEIKRAFESYLKS